MTALDKQALRSREEFEEYYNETHAVKVTSQFKRFGYYVSPTMQKAWELWQKAQSSMRDELKSAENNLIDSECHVAELEEALRDKQALLEAAENRIAELEARTVTHDVGVMNIGNRYCEDFLVAWTVSGKSLPPGIYYLDARHAGDIPAGIGVKGM